MQGLTISIEMATERQIDGLLQLVEKQFDEHHILFSPIELDAAIKEMVIRDDLGFFLTAIRDDQMIGFAAVSFAWTLEHGGKTAWLDELYVLPKSRNQGVGGMLLERAIEEAKRTGCVAIDLEVEAEHLRAEHLYARYGFNRLQRMRWVKTL